MLQLASLRNDVNLVKERLAVKNFKELELVDQIISIDDERSKTHITTTQFQNAIM